MSTLESYPKAEPGRSAHSAMHTGGVGIAHAMHIGGVGIAHAMHIGGAGMAVATHGRGAPESHTRGVVLPSFCVASAALSGHAGAVRPWTQA